MDSKRLAELSEWCETHPCCNDCQRCDYSDKCEEIAIELLLDRLGGKQP